LDLLLSLANETDGADAAQAREKDIAAMDLDDLVNAAFLDDDDD
jgi:polyketide synthase 12